MTISVDVQTPALNKVLARTSADESGCWLWEGPITRSGYGRVALGINSSLCVHRVTYEELVGPIPEGLEIDHLCRVRHCCNPEHLEPVTHAENVRRAVNFWATQTHCGAGHEYTNETTHWYRGYRVCRICRREKQSKERATPEYRARHAANERRRRIERKARAAA